MWFVLLGVAGAVVGFVAIKAETLGERWLAAGAGAAAGFLLIPLAAFAFKLLLLAAMLGLVCAAAYLAYLIFS